MALNLASPTAYTGQKATQYRQGSVRLATEEEALAGTANNVAVTPAQLQTATGADFASPPVLGFGSTTPRPVHATTLSAVGTTEINTSGAAVTTIGTGGTGAVALGNATGNTAVTGSLTASTGLVATSGGVTASAGNIVATLGNISTSAGAITSATTLTATLGAITATNGNLVLATAGNKLSIATGANASVGTSVAMTAGTVTISTTAVTASSKIFLSVDTPGGTVGFLSAPSASIVAGTSFVINSDSNTDTSTVNWWIVN